MGSSFGHLFRISTFGESHGGGVGVIVDGCPPRLPLDLAAIQAELDRRRPGQSRITTPRKEADQVEVLSGLLDGITLGTPISMVVRNQDQRPGDYKDMEVAFRPSHADATYQAKYGIQARSGGGRASARETIGRVAAGAIAKQLLARAHGTEVIAWVRRIHTIEAQINPAQVTLAAVEANIVRCPDAEAAERMIERIEAIGREGDSCGGVIECVVGDVAAGHQGLRDRLRLRRHPAAGQ
jgi:chorismate synthase